MISILDTTRFFWSSFKHTYLSPILSLWTQFRPLILLPFNIWFFFVSLPFRVLFAITSGSLLKKAEIKADQVKEALPSSLKPKAPIELRQRTSTPASEEDRQHGWYAVEKEDTKEEEKAPLRRRSLSKKSELSTSQPTVDESASLKESLSMIEQRERHTMEEKKKLEQEFEELSKRVHTDEAALANFEQERKRMKSLISVEQKKAFDFQQQIIALKNQLKKEHDANLELMKSEGRTEKTNLKKSTDHQKYAPRAEPVHEAPVEHHTEELGGSVWHKPAHVQDFTEMVAEAQKEELENSKSFSEVLKEAIKKEEPEISKPTAAEFVVLGGFDANHHITLPVTAV